MASEQRGPCSVNKCDYCDNPSKTERHLAMLVGAKISRLTPGVLHAASVHALAVRAVVMAQHQPTCGWPLDSSHTPAMRAVAKGRKYSGPDPKRADASDDIDYVDDMPGQRGDRIVNIPPGTCHQLARCNLLRLTA